MRFRWQLAPRDSASIDDLCQSLPISDLVAQCLVNRGYTKPATAEAFLQPRLKDLADPFLLPNMDAAVDRLWQAREAGELVVIFGDYDVDGVTSTTILLDVMPQLGWRVESYLPNRKDEGYGLGRDAVENCLEKHQIGLLLAVDCGSTSVDSIAWLKGQGIDTLVFDHHQVPEPAPEAVALVNPQLGDRFQELCSAGLAFKLAHALVKRGRENNDSAAQNYDVRQLLDLVALGTIADLVPLTDENRILTSTGLPRLSETRRPGLVALKEVAQCKREIGAYEVGFQLGPRLNAAGRLETATEALDLLVQQDAVRA
ncbi:MAG: single-stranded-DNA-specific exonuclease RecJ, partial [Limisphaerales bacterium]